MKKSEKMKKSNENKKLRKIIMKKMKKLASDAKSFTISRVYRC